jgi:serine/threonine protein kinase
VARQALRKCHELGIVHRDVKPPNLIYSAPPSDEGSLLKLVDYGLAARHSPGDEPLIEARRTRDAPRTPRAH